MGERAARSWGLRPPGAPRRLGPHPTESHPPTPDPHPPARPALTAQQQLELPVVEVGLAPRHRRAPGALPHGVHEAHAPQRHLLAAALVAEALPAAAAVVLARRHRRERPAQRGLEGPRPRTPPGPPS